MVRLGDAVDVKYGKALSAPNRRRGDVPVFGSNGIVGWHDTAITAAPVIVIGRKGSVGEVKLSDVPCWPIDTTYFIDDPGPFKMEFLDQLLRSLSLAQMDQSTAIPGLSRDRLYDSPQASGPCPAAERTSERDCEPSHDSRGPANVWLHRLAPLLSLQPTDSVERRLQL